MKIKLIEQFVGEGLTLKNLDNFERNTEIYVLTNFGVPDTFTSI